MLFSHSTGQRRSFACFPTPILSGFGTRALLISFPLRRSFGYDRSCIRSACIISNSLGGRCRLWSWSRLLCSLILVCRTATNTSHSLPNRHRFTLLNQHLL